jgi:membrane protein/epoxyqueuosine reductase
VWSSLKRIRWVVATLLSREIAVLTNAIAFNFLLCLFPLVLVVVAVSQQIGGHAPYAVFVLLQELIPFGRDELATSLRSFNKIAKGLQVLSLLLILWGSSGIFIPVEMALNHAWGGRSRSFVKSRLLAFLMTMAGGLLALCSVGLTLAARSYRHEWPMVASYAVKATAYLLTCMLFFLIYRLIPEAAVGSEAALKAALWSATAWEAVKYVFVVKLAQMNLPALYGPLALAVSLILWAYVSSLVLVSGALMVPVEGPPPRPRRRRGDQRA